MPNDAIESPRTWPIGPFEHEPRHRDLGVPAPTIPITDWTAWQRGRLSEALSGIEMGAFDVRILESLSAQEPTTTLVVIAGWIKRARRDAAKFMGCPGCDERGLDVRQEPTGDLVCHRCGRMVAATPEEVGE